MDYGIDCIIPVESCQGGETAFLLAFLDISEISTGIFIHNKQNKITKTLGIRAFRRISFSFFIHPKSPKYYA